MLYMPYNDYVCGTRFFVRLFLDFIMNVACHRAAERVVVQIKKGPNISTIKYKNPQSNTKTQNIPNSNNGIKHIETILMLLIRE